MALGGKTTRALLLGASLGSLAAFSADVAMAQAVDAVQSQKPKAAKKKRAAAQPTSVFPEPVRNANAQIGRQTTQSLDEITVTASKTEERAIDALAPVSVVSLDQIQGLQATRVADLIYRMPGVWMQDRGDDPSTSINIRGLQDFGRVAVVVDGARQNYQRTGHNANGSFFLNPELIGGIDITRGPTANIYGSGAIGGVASFRTKDIQDVLRPGETWGVDVNSVIGSNSGRALGSAFGGVRINPNVDFFAGGTYSTQDNYRNGDGTEVGNTANRLSAGIAKLTIRPADGHEVKLGSVFQESLYTNGQPNNGPTTTTSAPAAIRGTSVYDTQVQSYTNTLNWKYSKPEDKILDFDVNLYWNRTDQSQTKTYANRIHTGANPPFTVTPVCTLANPGDAITGCVGDTRGYLLDTYGIDIHNTSRFETGAWNHAITYGGDIFKDDVSLTDPRGNSNITTPPGTRTVSGAFAQWKATYPSIVELVGALRYDNYNLQSGSNSSNGDRLSPKITIGLLPGTVVTPYVSYAEGYRSPTVTETLISGAHASAVGAPPFLCPDGSRGMFCFLQNTSLRPEVGKNKEIGFNIKKNDLFSAGDSFRGKLNFFRNDVDNYIQAVTFEAGPTQTFFGQSFLTSYYQYQNLPHARIQGFEAETMYDAQKWFVGVSVTLQEGKETATNVGLYSVQPQKITTTAGLRFLDNTITTSLQWTSVKANTDLPLTYLPATSYDLLNFYVSARPTKDMVVSFSVENLLNQYYRPYAVPRSTATDIQNDTLWASAGAGVVFKGGLKYHFGG
ncbi:TonB-dependent hemoglobin/transferrin/lactoferrin family receptor [Tardiphaga alba]|uniref:TonB-dependent hemoglobin/transferrin/lactoferrin family receptor n=1 Tax=Tardiphaga alba TaxID=340268 RepID=A0ABX8AHW0_9BRAD|nr:TonB-dependent hemoglobin/transferrin/lactoferrin family receptor [Tardiphaga alba]QUS42536.1 TonB-dependent hemoglobin/transferrin/lactoferrin family receptor [Tardiphaga alba]